jgi:hypothetical protein
VTVDEELTLLEDSIRRLKVEYDVYFGGGAKRAPQDTEWRVQSLIKKYSDTRNLNFQQRFRYNTMVQKYSVYSDLWRQKLKIKEEGYRRKQDELLGIAGLHEAHLPRAPKPASFFVKEGDDQSIRNLFHAMHNAQSRAGQPTATWETFYRFVATKTRQIRQEHACGSVEYTVEVQDGAVRLKARAY